MSDTGPFGRTVAAVLGLLLVMSVLAPIGTVSAQSMSVDQSTSDMTFTPGELVTVEATIDSNDLDTPRLNVTLPSGWTVTDHEDDGGEYVDPEPAWVWNESVNENRTISYTVMVPVDAAPGEYQFLAQASGTDGNSTESDTHELTVTVEASAVEASFDVSPTDPEIGQSVTFDAADSSGNITDYQWTIAGDGVDSRLLLYSDFEEGSLADAGWNHTSINNSGAEGGVGATTSNSGLHSAFNSWGEAALVSPSMNTTGSESVTIEYWVREGSEPYGENPNPGEDLSVQYRAENGTWIDVRHITTDGGGGDVSTDTLTVDAEAAFHDEFQLRFYQFPSDYIDTWHIDDVTVTAHSEADEVTGDGETMTWAFGQPGTYAVELTVTNESGTIDTANHTVAVSEPTSSPYTVTEAIARSNVAGDNTAVDLREAQLAVSLATEDEPVPGADGGTISNAVLETLVDRWLTDVPTFVDGGGDDA